MLEAIDPASFEELNQLIEFNKGTIFFLAHYTAEAY
jgi:hypothetical protein